MKVRIISLFLSVAFLSILTLESISSTIIVENSNLKTIESIIEKRVADKFMDDTHLSHSIINSLIVKTDITYKFKQTFYTFKSTSTLFRPPISI